MKIRLSLRTARGDQRNIQFEADGTATVGDVATALSPAESAEPCTLRVSDPVTGVSQLLAPRTTLLDSGVRSGVIVEVARPTSGEANRQPNAAVIRVLHGPDEGVEVRLPVGTATVGRAADCDVRLSDRSVSAHHLKVLVGSRVEVQDTNSSNGVFVGSLQVASAAVGPGEQIRIGETILIVSSLGQPADRQSTDVRFVRSPRVFVRPQQHESELPDAPERDHRQSFPWVAMIAPLVMGAVLYAFTQSLLSVVFIALSPILMIGSWLANRIDQRRQLRLATEDFERALESAATTSEADHERDRQHLLTLYPSAGVAVDAIRTRSDYLWCRRPEHPEFLQLRLGLGTIAAPSRLTVRSTGKGIPELVEKARKLAASSTTLPDAPVVMDFPESGSIGVSGSAELTTGVLAALVIQAAALHSPAELSLCCLTSTTRKVHWTWMEWMPHSASPHSPLAGAHLSADAASGHLLLDELEALAQQRLAGTQGQSASRGPLIDDERRPRPAIPAVLVIVDQTLASMARLTRLSEVGPDAGIYLLWVAAERQGLPAACRTFLEVADPSRPQVGMVRRGATVQPVRCESIDQATVTAVARLLAPMVDAGVPVEDESDLPQDVSVVALLGREACDDPAVLLGRWRENRSLLTRDGGPVKPLDRPPGLRATVGHNGKEPFVLDLRVQGPHALVGGTTGAGKSEFLQAWVLALAHAYSPDRVSFLFVDYKGGAAFSQCLKLPHTVGLVTDLTPYLVRRALRSLGAEIRRRELLLNAKGVKDLIELEQTGDPDCPPSLIIVVDEFAALVGEVPEFVDGVVDVAQRGRSLGLHLVLATQRPAGVIKDNLRANTNLRIALRMADESDSVDVVGDPLAAHFSASRPGRAAAKTGPGRLLSFQSAYPGARTPDQPITPPIDVVDLDFGLGTPWQRPERAGALPEDLQGDAVRVVATIRRAVELGGIPAPRRPWLPTLAKAYDLVGLKPGRDNKIVLGVVDDPDAQAQLVEYFFPDSDANIMFVGAAGSGKTTALRSLTVAMSVTPRSGPVHVYGIDAAGGGLSLLDQLPNVGSIIDADDLERVGRLMRYVATVVDERIDAWKRVGADHLTEFRTLADQSDAPRILILIDGFASFRAGYEDTLAGRETYALFQRLILDGRALGVHFALTADQPRAVPTSVASSIPRRIILRQADEDAYAALGVPKDVLTPSAPPGRALQPDKPLELQLAILGQALSTAGQARELEELARVIAPYHRNRPAKIRRLPTIIPAESLPDHVAGSPVLGVGDLDLKPVPFTPSGTIVISGPPRSGRTNALVALAIALHRAHPATELVHLSPMRSGLSGLAPWAHSLCDFDDVSAQLPSLIRQCSVAAGSAPATAVFVESLAEFSDTPVDSALADLFAACRRSGQLIVAEAETSALARCYSLLQAASAMRTGLILRPDTDDGDRILKTPLPLERSGKLPPGRGYWVSGGNHHKVQLPLVL